MRRLSSLVPMALLLLAGCAPFVDVVNVDPSQAVLLQKEVRIYEAADLANKQYQSLSNVDATSCMLYLWDPPATEKDATNQLLYKAKNMNANGITAVTCEGGGAGALIRNCWSTVKCSAEAIRLAQAR